jgi:hypothetical protein
MKLQHLLPILLLALAAADATAQYKWRDANGRTVYSDLPPPVSAAPSVVLDAPARQASAVATVGSGGSADQAVAKDKAAPVTRAAPLTPADRELESRKRAAEKTAAERKTAATADRDREMAEQCAQARSNLEAVDSGMRLAQINSKGEREILDDAQRAARADQARNVMKAACKS